MLRYDQPIKLTATTQQKVAIQPEIGPSRRQPVGRGRKVLAAVLAATIAELVAAGYADLSVEGVALRAGVHKTTVYRRWTDRESLVADALTDSIAREVPIPNTGAVETDLREHARSLVSWLTSPTGDAIISTMISGDHIPEIAEIKRRFFEDRLWRAEPIVARAIARGELPVGTDSAQVIKTLIAPIYLRLLITAERLDETTAADAAHIAVAAARAGALQRPHPGL